MKIIILFLLTLVTLVYSNRLQRDYLPLDVNFEFLQPEPFSCSNQQNCYNLTCALKTAFGKQMSWIAIRYEHIEHFCTLNPCGYWYDSQIYLRRGILFLDKNFQSIIDSATVCDSVAGCNAITCGSFKLWKEAHWMAISYVNFNEFCSKGTPYSYPCAA